MRQSRLAAGRLLVWPLLFLFSGPLLAAGCRSLRHLPQLPCLHSVMQQQLVVHSDFPLPAHHPVLDQLSAQREIINGKLGLPATDTPIHVYLYESTDAFQAFILEHYPDFPERRAFFVETEGRLNVYAHWGDRVAEDLRHEVAHGYLHAAVPAVPLWLDEGLAEYFEVSANSDGLNAAHVAELGTDVDRGDWWPDLGRLESLESVASMTQQDYAESWAWVHFFLETTDARRARLRRYLLVLRTGATTEPLLDPRSESRGPTARALVDHVTSLRRRAGPPRPGGHPPIAVDDARGHHQRPRH